jgi:hypothetical protein
MERFERLREHGFTVVVPQSDWRYLYPPEKGHDKIIVQAISQVNALPSIEDSRRAGYDFELADEIMESLNEIFPHPACLIEIKYQFRVEPPDSVLLTALNALRGDGYIDGVRNERAVSLNPMERITLTKEGRRHLEEMKRGSFGSSHGNDTQGEASQFILAQMLAEFRERKLTSADLRSGYEGLSPAELKSRSIAEGISEVDFDLAMRSLERLRLLMTGPIEMPKPDPFGSVLILIPFSRNEYSYLSEEGYKEATRRPLRVNASSARTQIHISGGTFHNSPIAMGGTVKQSVTSAPASMQELLSVFRCEAVKLIDNEARREEILSRLGELEAASDKPTMIDRYNNLVATIGNHITVLGFLLPPLWEMIVKH